MLKRKRGSLRQVGTLATAGQMVAASAWKQRDNGQTVLSRCKRGLAPFIAAALTIAVAGCAAPEQKQACEALSTVKIKDARSVKAEYVTKGYHFSLITALIGLPWFKVPDSCRVTLDLAPSQDSHIVTEVWLPRTEWNGRLWSLGNGGLAGSLDEFKLMNVALSRGYAVSTTDTGHEAEATDGKWALGHPEKIVDYGYRAIHETALAAKVLVKAYYGRPANHAYFSYGSNGGRAALMEAQRYPDDYDGIIAGAPAYHGTANLAEWGWIQRQYAQKPESWISPEKLPAIAAAVMKECDAKDGLADGLIDDPRQCHFNPAVLLCTGGDNDNCLTKHQVAMLRAIYSGPDGKSGVFPGGELHWKDWITGEKPGKGMAADFLKSFYRYLVYGDPSWTVEKTTYARDVAEIERRLGSVYNATNPDLSRFAARGGKLIMYHGWNDTALSPALTIAYYEQVQSTLGAEKTNSFSRLYMVPGMEHVFLGPGPNNFGNIAPPPANADPHTDIGAALESWVEKGTPPGAIVAAKYEHDMRALLDTEGMTPVRTRPLCPYPQVARWIGRGSIDKAENFKCISPMRP